MDSIVINNFDSEIPFFGNDLYRDTNSSLSQVLKIFLALSSVSCLYIGHTLFLVERPPRRVSVIISLSKKFLFSIHMRINDMAHNVPAYAMSAERKRQRISYTPC